MFERPLKNLQRSLFTLPRESRSANAIGKVLVGPAQHSIPWLINTQRTQRAIPDLGSARLTDTKKEPSNETKARVRKM